MCTICLVHLKIRPSWLNSLCAYTVTESLCYLTPYQQDSISQHLFSTVVQAESFINFLHLASSSVPSFSLPLPLPPSFIQNYFFEHLLYPRHHSRVWEHRHEQNRGNHLPWSLHFPGSYDSLRPLAITPALGPFLSSLWPSVSVSWESLSSTSLALPQKTLSAGSWFCHQMQETCLWCLISPIWSTLSWQKH